ncbi:hypothetical protein PVAP13_8KG065536 [Panicum virgatum]|uniref:Uncharacterized protein n=1 Tax=Panicum virgatum TaxID=38727 RepID=A0A8T0PF38_PANVG|nr:hypothetical protein PVAP13_8KG065536 [Panicum virgatum]
MATGRREARDGTTARKERARVISRQRRGILRRLYTVVCYACPGQ